MQFFQEKKSKIKIFKIFENFFFQKKEGPLVVSVTFPAVLHFVSEKNILLYSRESKKWS